MPIRSDGSSGDPKPHQVPPPSTVAHCISERLRMCQPPSTGTRPCSVSSIFASCMAPEAIQWRQSAAGSSPCSASRAGEHSA